MNQPFRLPKDDFTVASPGPGVGFSGPAGFSVGGVTSWSLEMTRRLQAAGHRALWLNHPHTDLPQIPPDGIADLTVFQGFPIARPGLFGRNVEVYRRALPSVFIPNWSAETYGICARLSRSAASRLRVIGYCHSDEPLYYRFLHYYEPLVHRFVAVSEECGHKLRQWLPGRTRDIIVRPYAVTATRTSSRSYAPEGHPLRLLYAGRIDQAQKRVFDLPRLVQALAIRQIPFHLRIVGDGPDRGALLARLESLPESIRQAVSVERGVPQDQMAGLFHTSDICILVSAYEGTSLFMLEGMAHGCVPVVTRVSGTSGVIDEGREGFCHAVGDLEGMADTIGLLARDRSRLAALGIRAQLKTERFSYEDYLEWFLELVHDVWCEPPRRWPRGKPFVPGLNSLLRRTLTALPVLRKIRHYFPVMG